MPDQSRRSFLRAAIIGATGVAAVEACPDWLAEALLPKKTYFLPSPGNLDPSLQAYFQVDLYFPSPRACFKLTGVEAPASIELSPEESMLLRSFNYNAFKAIEPYFINLSS